jgi:hypothetical protein
MVDERLIAGIRRFHRDRCFMMDTRKVVDLRLGAHLRRVLGWRMDLPEAERKAIAAEASRVMEDGDGPYEKMIAASHAAREIFAENEEAARKEMAKLAALLPVWESFGKAIRGFGEVSLAVIVAEAGDLSDYDSDAKLWKRMGLAPGQNRVPPGLSREDRAKAWITRGYSPKRRSQMWNVGAALIKAQVRVVKDADGKDTGERIAIGKYGEVFLRRKLHTQQTHREWWRDKDGNPKLDPKTGRPTSDHGNKDAQHYMEKRLLRDLWRAWRRADPHVAERPVEKVPAAPFQQAAE